MVLKPGQNMWRQCCSKNQIIVFWNSTEYVVPIWWFFLSFNSIQFDIYNYWVHCWMFKIQNLILFHIIWIHFQTLQLIFVYLKMPKTHCNVSFPLRTEGKIHYTRPFNMLKAIDRAEVCEFLYWLGCIQNRYGRKLLMWINTGSGARFKEEVSKTY